MFSKKPLIIIGVIVLLTINIIAVSVVDDRYPRFRPGTVMISLIAPFQEVVTKTIRFSENLWRHYFFLVSTAKENDKLKKELKNTEKVINDTLEIKLSNDRLRNLLNFQKSTDIEMIACEVIANDPSSLFKTIIIDKGESDGLKRGLPVVVPEGIVGQIIDVSYHYSKVLLVIDSNSAVDALVQRTRARGLIKGSVSGNCRLDYVLRKLELDVGDILISSGLDGVYPKGLKLGKVSHVVKQNSGIFQETNVTPFVDFQKLEEVLVLLNPPHHELKSEQ